MNNLSARRKAVENVLKKLKIPADRASRLPGAIDCLAGIGMRISTPNKFKDVASKQAIQQLSKIADEAEHVAKQFEQLFASSHPRISRSGLIWTLAVRSMT